jgi:hypothetical protein
MAAGHQHHLEFGGSHVTTEFDGSLQFRAVDRIPYLSVSQTFTPKTARQIRYLLVSTVGPERPFYHRYQYVILDVRMIGAWEPGSGDFVNALRDRLTNLGGELFLVATTSVPVNASLPKFTTADAAIAAAKELRANRRRAAISS